MSVVKPTKKQWCLIGTAFVLLLVSTVIYATYHNLQRAQSVARINGEYIPLESFEARRDFRTAFLEAREQTVDPELVASETYELTIDHALIAQYARGQGLSVDEPEIDERIEHTQEQLGEEEFSLRLTELYGDDTSPYREVIRADILREKVARDLGDTSLAQWLAAQRSEARIERYSY